MGGADIQGEGVAVECALTSVTSVGHPKPVVTPWTRLESDTRPISAGSARPLEDAWLIPQLDLVRWLARGTHTRPRETAPPLDP